MAVGGSMAGDKGYLKGLLKKACAYCKGGPWGLVRDFYRNKPSGYFKDLATMMPTVKDNGGDPRCPVNGKLSGVFFGVTPWDGDLPIRSPFGDTRVKVPLERVFDESARLYFADFYCMSGQTDNHYVTLVLTKAYSPADEFCHQHLIHLDERNNIFLMKEAHKFNHRDLVSTLFLGKVWVEVFYTHKVPMQGLELTTTDVLGSGRSTQGGIPKTNGCPICNL
ncbi:phytanoyl-CoA hydroxylase interacting protein-like [Haliotis rufescens]|uniref:phytanoyl-CoA hydroxylase interacting protein-like n=1 Tax=Haliotis rufescens TaxID=6454 RepID=UPI00201E9B5C|nr:phytanoyl-CoA hydroxylase interacting protein-like [Haliotis rufescens]